MSLYRVRYDGGESFVEAESFGRAVTIWRADVLRRFGIDSGWDAESEPDSVELLSEDAVLRPERTLRLE